MKIFKILCLAYISIVLLSCKKNVLDKQPLSEINSDLIFVDIKLSNLYLNNAYLGLEGGIEQNLDATTETEDDGPDWHPTQLWNLGDVNPVNSSFEDWFGVWNRYYTNIRIVNTVLQNYKTIKASKIEIDRLKGQAYFLRAHYYSNLLSRYNGVPIIKIPQKLGDDISVPRNSWDEGIAFVVSDLDSASILLPVAWENSNDIGRATKGAALAQKARMLLYDASPLHNLSNNKTKWQIAADAAKAVIDLKNYDLYPDYYEVFHLDNNSEVIFANQFQHPVRTQNSEYKQNPQQLEGAYGELRPTEDFVSSYEMANGKKITDPTSDYDPQNPYIGRDPRFYKTILYNGADWRGINVETFMDGANGPGENDEYGTGLSMTGYYSRKFINEKYQIIDNNSRSNSDWILIRYAEVLLNYAEAQLNLDNESEAITYLNKIRKRVGMPDIPNSETGATLIARYRNERRIELAFEEHHFFDLRRWKTAPLVIGKPVHKMSIVKNNDDSFAYSVEEMEDRVWNDKLYYWPIPQDEINKNKNLVQNPGY